MTSNSAVVTVTVPPPQPPSFTRQPAAVTAVVGSTVSLVVAAAGTPAPTLQWYRDGARLAGQTGTTLTLAKAAASDSGSYTCEATNASGTVRSQAAVVAVGQPPSLVKAAAIIPVEAKVGESLKIDLPQLAGSLPLSYQWSREGAAVAGTGAVLDITSLGSTASGLYSCTVSNAFGSIRIDRVRVALLVPPAITAQPQSVTTTGSATFRVTATGTPAPSYQWFRNGVAISGQSSSQLVVSGTSAIQNAGGYHCVVSNRAGSVSSSVAWYTASGVAAGAPSISRTVRQLEFNRSVRMADSDSVFLTGLGYVTASFSTYSSSGTGTDRTAAGAEYFNGELRPRAGSTVAFEANYVRRTPVAYVDYGNVVVALPTLDADGDGINDAFDYRLDGGVVALGSGYDYAGGTPFSAEVRFTRSAGSAKGRYVSKTTTPLGLTAEVAGDFYLGGPTGIRVGTASYTRGTQNRMNVSVASDASVTGNTTGSSMSGSFTFAVVDRDTVNYDAFTVTSNENVQYSVRAGSLKRKGTSYSGIMTFVDGRVSTSFVDYASFFFSITDANDADADGIPDLTDDLPAAPVLASFSGTGRTLEPGARLEISAAATGPVVFTWKRDGVVLRTSGTAASDTLSIAAVAPGDSGSYSVEITNAGGTATSPVVAVVVQAAAAAPTIRTQPIAGEVANGGNLVLAVDPAGGSGLRFQWRKDGTDIPGATNAVYARLASSEAESGYYSVLVTNSQGAVLSNVVRVNSPGVAEARAILGNLSVISQLKPNVPLIVGAAVQGTGKPFLVRMVGPALGNFGVEGVRETEVNLYDSSQASLATARGWDAGLAPVFSLVGAFPLPGGSSDTALVRAMGSSFTVHAYSPGSGAALVELYDATRGSGSRLVNLSVRNQVGSGGDILIVGLAVVGSGKMNVLVRAVGPTLAGFGLSGVLADPQISVYAPGGASVAANDNWSSDLGPVFSRVGAFGLPAGSRDAALLLSVDAGSVYSVHVSGVNGATGEAMVEVYEVP